MTPIHYEGLVFRSYVPDDAPSYLAAVQESVETVAPWMPSRCHPRYALTDALQWFADCDSSRAAETAFEFGIFDAQTNEFLGGAAAEPDLLAAFLLQPRLLGAAIAAAEGYRESQRPGAGRPCLSCHRTEAGGNRGGRRKWRQCCSGAQMWGL